MLLIALPTIVRVRPIGFSRALPASILRRQCLDVLDCALDPPFERLIGGGSGGCDVDHRADRATSEVHWPDVRFVERSLGRGVADAEDQVVADDAAGHVAADQEREPAKHLSLSEVGDPREEVPDALRELLVVHISDSCAPGGACPERMKGQAPAGPTATTCGRPYRTGSPQ